MIKIALLGSTGSIGVQTLNIVLRHRDEFEIVSLAAGGNARAFFEQIETFRPRVATLARAAEEISHPAVKRGEGGFYYDYGGGERCALFFGKEAYLQAVVAEADVVEVALVGFIGVRAVLKAARMKKKIALANKESLVVGGALVIPAVEKAGVELAPIDSEHSAVWQALGFDRGAEYEKIILTASGGAFRDRSAEELETVTSAEALKHPNWDMGGRITVDCATMVNKAFEVMEAMWLYDAKAEQVEVVVHPQSVIHSMVQFKDGAVLAQLGVPSMEVPIQLALTAPKRLDAACAKLDFKTLGALTFQPVDREKYPCFYIALKSMALGDNYPCALNAADEIAVGEFLRGNIRFTDIARVLENTLRRTARVAIDGEETLVREDEKARALAKKIISELNGTSTA
ncbi:MAG: 1-deoxy-D-xylulose-5-phosphate reductoisomerase [Bacillota bacterium]|nr:MAG: 1-deoxy-D-xylulose-5-phosphate reductoisomerase [Bacillota bacterium]